MLNKDWVNVTNIFFFFFGKWKKIFICYHGDTYLKAEVNSVSKEIYKYVKLPRDVINFFVKCRFLFSFENVKRKLVTLANKGKKKKSYGKYGVSIDGRFKY